MTAPTLTGLGNNTFGENTVNATPQVIDSAVSFADADNDFNGGTLVVSGLLAEDTVSIQSSGLISYNSGTGEVSYGGVVFGIVSGGVGSTLTVVFDSDATAAAIDALIEHLTYGNSSNTPTLTRTLTINVTDTAGNNLGGSAALTERTGAANPLNAYSFGIGGNTSPVLVDLNHDGLLDVVVGVGSGGTYAYFQNTGTASTPAFTQLTGASNPFNGFDVSTSATPTFADIDNDGDLDMISGSAGGDLFLFRNTGTISAPAFSLVTGGADPFAAFNAAYDGSGSERDSYVAVGDLDNDGDLDLLTGHNAGTLHYLRNDGTAATPSFTEVTGAGNPADAINVGNHAHGVLIDQDADGDLDLVIGIYTGTVSYFENTGTASAPVFVERTGSANPYNTLPDVGFLNTITIGDLTGDGYRDVILGSENGALRYFQNTTTPPPGSVITVTAQNDAPVASSLPTDVTVTEDVASDLDLSAVSLTDPDTGGSISVVLSANAGTIAATSGGGVTVSNSGTGAITLSGTISAIDTFLNTASNIQYTGAANANGNNAAVLTITADDGSGVVTLGTINIDITAVNDAPTLTGLSTSVTFLENTVNAAAQLIDTDVTLGDVEGNLDGGHLVISGLLAEDTIAFKEQGNGAGQIHIDGMGIVFYGGVSIGQSNLPGVTATGATLNITFNANATIAAIEALIEDMTYANSSDTPTTSRVLTVSFSDGAADSVIQTITVNVTPQAEGPTQNPDILTGTTGGDTINALGGNDVVDGGDGNDVIDGGMGDDVLTGGLGNDYLKGGLGADTMTGGTGNDTYIVDDLGDVITEDFDEGTDLVRASVNWTLGANFENLDMLSGGAAVNGTGNELANIITGNSYDNTLQGMEGNDTLTGGGGVDVLQGGDGADNLDGGTGNDTLEGGDGDDNLVGGAGNDRLDGGTGFDNLAGGLGNDLYIIDDNNDSVFEAANAGTDTVEASITFGLAPNFENLTLTGSGNIDGDGNALRNVIIGNSGNNVLHGGDEVDTISGGDGADTLYGDAGNDILNGGANDDFIYGGAGSDKLTGGTGADGFAFTDLDIRFSAMGQVAEKDQILDLAFARGDFIDLHAIDANTLAGGDQAFTWAVGNKFTKHAGEAVLTFSAGTGITTLQLDVDGDGKADFRIDINGDLTGTKDNHYTGIGDANGGWVL